MLAITKQPVSHNDKTGRQDQPTDVSNLPDGLKQLAELNEITIHECLGKIDVCCYSHDGHVVNDAETVTVKDNIDIIYYNESSFTLLLGHNLCCHRPSRYTIHASGDEDDDHFLYAQEVSECYARQCLGALRGFTMKISNKDQQDLIKLERPQRCPCSICWWWCCCIQELRIENPPGTQIAAIMEDRICCASYYVEDEHDRVILRTGFNCCLCKLCSDVKIKIQNEQHETIAEILKDSKCRTDECCGSRNDYTIRYLRPLHIQDKIIILGSSFLIDFNFFEGQQRTCC